MIPNHKAALIKDNFPNSKVSNGGTTSAWRPELRMRIASRLTRILVAAAVVFAMRRPMVAQEAVHTEATPAIAAAGTQANVARAELPEAPRPTSDPGTPSSPSASPAGSATATIGGTVLDVNGDLVPGATVVLKGVSSDDRREAVADDNGAFKFDSVTPGIPYEVSVHIQGFTNWSSPAIVLQPSQFFLENIHLKMEGESTSITVLGSTEQIAVEQVHLEEQQRVLGFIPNFYVVYDSANAVPLTTKLKFQLAMKVSTDPITVAGVAFMSGVDQASDRPGYVQGWKGFGQRFGANAAGGLSDIMIGGAILPSLLHQDPRYFYQGTGGTKSRLKHAMSSPFICRGDNGQRQINYSSMGGDLGATALSMAYYPDSDRGAGMVIGTFAINTAERVFSAVAQEFIIPRLTPSLRHSK